MKRKATRSRSPAAAAAKASAAAVSPRGRPRAAGADEAILDATLEQLATEGYSRMSLDAVAAAAATTKPTIYRRWPSKDALVVAALARLQGEAVPARTGDTKADLIAALRDFRVKLLRPNGMSMIGVVLAEERHLPELIERFRDELAAPRRRALRAILDDGVREGVVRRGADLDAAVSMLVGSFYGSYIATGTVPDDWPERIVRVLLEGLAPRPRH